jgi:hypothetical protein
MIVEVRGTVTRERVVLKVMSGNQTERWLCAYALYDRELQVFYFVVFDEGRDDSLTAAEFDDLVTEYNPVSWTAHPALLRRAVGKPGMA